MHSCEPNIDVRMGLQYTHTMLYQKTTDARLEL